MLEIAQAFCPLLAYANHQCGRPQRSCDMCDCDRCAHLYELLKHHSDGHEWVCWVCAEKEGRGGKLVGFYLSGFCDRCGGVEKGRTLGDEEPADSLLQLLDLTGAIDTEVRRRYRCVP